MDWLTQFLFAHTRETKPDGRSVYATKPDGRPLYAYKMRDATYAELKDLSRQLILQDQKGKSDPSLARVFCLYAAETFCREHADGPWAWETVFKPLGVEEPSRPKIYDWVEKGLERWSRPLLRDSSGDRQFLVSIACEGGLPLQLLQREGAHLTQFFRSVLEHYYRMGQGGFSVAEASARQQAHRLPRSLRQEPVFHLAGALIAKIADLQPHVGSTSDPLAALDQLVPDWRRDLPLRLDDQVAEALLTGLMHCSTELAQEATARIGWRGRLRESGVGWRLEKRMDFPERPTAEQVATWIDVSGHNRPRWRLLLHSSLGTEAVAWLTLLQGEGNSARYRREWLRPGGVTLVGAAVRQSHCLSLHDGQREYPLAKVRNADPWGDAPWVFIERGASGEREWLTEGSARTRSEQAWVLAMSGLVPSCEGTGVCECVGSIPELDRVVYRVGGEVDFLTPQHDRFRIVCRADGDSEETFVVEGACVPQALQQRPLYRGLLRIQALDPDGQRCQCSQ